MKKVNIGIVKVYLANKLGESYLLNKTINESDAHVSDFVKTINESPILQLEFRVFDNIEKKHITNESAASRYIDSNVKLFEVYTLKELNAEHDKLLPLMAESGIIDSPKLRVYDAIDNLIVESLKKNSDVDVDIIDESFTIVLNHIMNNKPSAKKEKLQIFNESVIEIAIDKFNERYDALEDSDRTLLSTLFTSNNSDKENIFETLKSDNIELLSKVEPDPSLGERIEKTINKLNEMKCNFETINEDIITLHELKQTLL